MHTVKIKIEACPEKNNSGKCTSLKTFGSVIDFDWINWVKFGNYVQNDVQHGMLKNEARTDRYTARAKYTLLKYLNSEKDFDLIIWIIPPNRITFNFQSFNPDFSNQKLPMFAPSNLFFPST